MNIRPSAAIRQNYNEIADLCRETAEPIFLTKNGEGDLVVMDIETYNRREKMLKLREELLSVVLSVENKYTFFPSIRKLLRCFFLFHLNLYSLFLLKFL